NSEQDARSNVLFAARSIRSEQWANSQSGPPEKCLGALIEQQLRTTSSFRPNLGFVHDLPPATVFGDPGVGSRHPNFDTIKPPLPRGLSAEWFSRGGGASQSPSTGVGKVPLADRDAKESSFRHRLTMIVS